MLCPSCGHENRSGARFCVRCRTALPRACPRCGTEAAPDDRFCAECGADLPAAGIPSASVAPRAEAAPASANPRPDTPAHLAERILAARAHVVGERKQVTVLFAAEARAVVQQSDRRIASRIATEIAALPAPEHAVALLERLGAERQPILGSSELA